MAQHSSETKMNELEQNMKTMSLSESTETNYTTLNYKTIIKMSELIVKENRSNIQYYNYTPRNKHTKFISSLPKNLQIDRKDWTKHESFTTQTLLIRSHRNFRSSSQRCVQFIFEALKSNKNTKKQLQSIKTARNMYYSLMSSLQSHSRYEENKLFKYLEIKYNVNLSLLLEDHNTIHQLEEKCKSTLNDIIYCGQITKELLLKCLICFLEFDDVFTRHLGEEESIVIPMLMELTYKEYVIYYNARTYKQALGIY
eukprot:467094_1